MAILKNDENEWRFWVSWNGATEVDSWVLQGASDAEADEDEWEDLDELNKDSFETDFGVMASYPRYLRMIALDASRAVLGTSMPLDAIQEQVSSSKVHSQYPY